VYSTEVSLQPELLGATVKDTRIQFETIGGAALDMELDDLKFELLDASATSIIVPSDGIMDCWGKGVDVLITSHTLNFNDSQVRTLTANPKSVGNGFVRLDLNEAIVQPITSQDSPDFAVEIAFLSRNILFQGDADPLDSLLGAHFMIMQTPAVAQLIDGAEFRNFGQQGVLGRYVSSVLQVTFWMVKYCCSTHLTLFGLPADSLSSVRGCEGSDCNTKHHPKFKTAMHSPAWQ
jgi:hypothetical protein